MATPSESINCPRYLSGAPAREVQTEARLRKDCRPSPDNTLAAHRLRGRPQTVENIRRPKFSGANLSFQNQDQLMANTAADPLHSLLERVIQSSEQRRLRRIDYTRSLTASMQHSGRVFEREEAQLRLAEQAYSIDVARVVMQSRIYVHSMEELEALMQAVEDATRPFSLRSVSVQNPDPQVTEEIRMYLENGGFASVVEENDTFTFPPQMT